VSKLLLSRWNFQPTRPTEQRCLHQLSVRHHRMA
jgi:hypothetical protein